MASGNTLYENHLDHLVEEANDIKAGGEDLMERGMDLKAGEVEWKFIGWQCCLKTTTWDHGGVVVWEKHRQPPHPPFCKIMVPWPFCECFFVVCWVGGRKSCLVALESMLDAIPLQVVRSSWVMCSHPSLMLKIYRLMRCGCRPVCEGPWRRFFQVGKNMSVETCINWVWPTFLVAVTHEGL